MLLKKLPMAKTFPLSDPCTYSSGNESSVDIEAEKNESY